MILSSFPLSSLPPSFGHSSISSVTIHLSPLSSCNTTSPTKKKKNLSLPTFFSTLHHFSSLPFFIHTFFFYLFPSLRSPRSECFILSGTVEMIAVGVKAVLSLKCQHETEKTGVCLARWQSSFCHYPFGFGHASMPKRLKNLEEHVIL